MPADRRRATLELRGDRELLITRTFDAPPDLVYRAITEPDLVRRWWHANRGEIREIEIDLRIGGRWRHVMVAAGDFEVAFHGEYRELVPGTRVVSTEVFEGAPGGDENGTVNTITLTPLDDGRTLLTVHIEAPSPEVRDAIVGSGMEDGMQDAYDLLDAVAASLA